MLVFALFDGVAGAWDLLPRAIEGQPPRVTFGGWLLQAAGLVGLYLLIRGRTGSWWLDGLAVGWTAWLFRGPLVVVTLAGVAGQSQQAWWRLTIAWWWLYCLCGLLLAALARRMIVAVSTSQPSSPRTPLPTSSTEATKPSSPETLSQSSPPETPAPTAPPPPTSPAALD